MPTWSGLWNGQFNQAYAPLPQGNTAEYNKTKWTQLAKLTRGGPAGRKMGALIKALTGAAPGVLAQAGVYQVPANPAPGQAYSGGGYVKATYRTELNRNTTAADEQWIDSAVDLKFYPTYPKDKAGVGGAKPPGYF